jgi:hypothetical protein
MRSELLETEFKEAGGNVSSSGLKRSNLVDLSSEKNGGDHLEKGRVKSRDGCDENGKNDTSDYMFMGELLMLYYRGRK